MTLRPALLLIVGLAAACRTSGSTAATAKHLPVELPVVVEEHRFFLEAKTASGAPLRLFLDSAGGMGLLQRAVERLQLATQRTGDETTAEFPKFYDARIPRPRADRVGVWPDAPLADADGMLGAPWFAERVFTFDYGGKRLWLRAAGDLPSVPAAHRVSVGFPRAASGAVASPFGRIQMQVDGATLDMLLDTGATVVLTPAAQQQLGGAAKDRATSFITERVFARWRAAHPAWRVIEAADQTIAGSPMIEVPKLAVGGYEIGPVWFTRRPDKTFHEVMAQSMDKPTDGALGGSALHHFQRVTVDWQNATATFEK